MKNITHKVTFIVYLISLSLLTISVSAVAQEHPKEHPKEKAKEPSKESANVVSKESLGEAIAGYIHTDSELKGGYFIYYDKKTKKPLILTIDKVHKDKLAKVNEDKYFACTDFKDVDGQTYDMDFFMTSTEAGLQVSEIMLHKVQGKPRYGWYEQDGLWIRK